MDGATFAFVCIVYIMAKPGCSSAHQLSTITTLRVDHDYQPLMTPKSRPVDTYEQPLRLDPKVKTIRDNIYSIILEFYFSEFVQSIVVYIFAVLSRTRTSPSSDVLGRLYFRESTRKYAT